MKKIFGLLLALFITLSTLTVQAATFPKMSGRADTTEVYSTDAGTTATMTVVAAATTKYYTLYQALISGSANDTFTIKCGTTAKSAFQVLASTPVLLRFWPHYIQCSANEALVITKTSGTTAHVTLWYGADQ